MNSKSDKKPIRTYRDLNVYQLAMEIFEMTKKFPKDELYSLTTQIRKLFRSVPGNIGEGWAKRKYKNVFMRHLVDANGSCEETKIWLDFSRDCKYINVEEHASLVNRYREVGAMLNSLMKNWKSYESEKK